MMTDNQKKLLNLIDHALHDHETTAFQPEEWPAVYQEMQVQAIAALPENHLDFSLLPEQDFFAYMKETGKNVRYFYAIQCTQARCLAVLADIPVVVLKGAAAAMYYPSPEKRRMGDVDLLTRRGDFEKAYKALENAGYTPGASLNDVIRHIDFRSPEGVSIELHEHFSSSTNEAQNKALDALIDAGIEHREQVNVCGFEVPVLPALENGLVLLAHINHHLAGGLGLRQIIDWQCYVEKELSDERWPAFSTAAEQIGMQKLAVITTAMCQKYLGLRGIRWCHPADDSLCDEFMAYIFASGNFGSKTHTRSYTVKVVRNLKNPLAALRQAQRTGRQTWPLAQKHPWLKPFAWAYQIPHWLKLRKQRGMKLTDLAGSVSAEEQQKAFLSKLGVTRIN